MEEALDLSFDRLLMVMMITSYLLHLSVLSPVAVTSSLNKIQVKTNNFFFTIFQGFEGDKEQVVNFGTANLRSKTVGVDTVAVGGCGGRGNQLKLTSTASNSLKCFRSVFKIV